MKPLSRKQRRNDAIFSAVWWLLLVGIGIAAVLLISGCASSGRSTITPARQSGTIQERGPSSEIIIEVGTPPAIGGKHSAVSWQAALVVAVLCSPAQPVLTTTTQAVGDDSTTIRGPDGWSVSVPKGESARITARKSGGEVDARQESATAGASSTGDAIAAMLKTKLGAMSFPRLAARGGGMAGTGSNAEFDIEAASGGGAAALYVIGALTMLAGCAAGYFAVPKSVKLAAFGVGMGVLLIACGVVAQQYPWVFLVALLVAFAGAGAWIYQIRKGSASITALRTVTQGIESITDAANPESLGNQFKKRIGERLKRSRVRAPVEKAIEAALGTPDPTK